MDCTMPSFPVLYHLPEFTQTCVHWVSDAIHPSHPHLIPFSFFSVFPSIRVFSSELALHFRWPGYWIFSFRISPSNEYSVWISFRIDWFNLLAVQETPKSLLQHHSLRASILHHSASLMVQLSHWYMTTGKSIALTIQTFVTKWYLFFNMLSRFVITFLLKSKFMAIVTTVILEPPFPPNKVCHCFHFFHYVLAIISLRTEGGVLDLVTW